MITTTTEDITYLNKTKNYTIDIDGTELTVNKWWKDDSISGNYECDYEILEQDTLAKLTDEQQDELSDYIMELN